MRLVEQHRIDRHDPRWIAIDAATFASKNLYNAALYLTRQAYIKDHTILSYGELDKRLQPTGEYRALPAKVAQWVLRQVALAWKSYFAACAVWEADSPHLQGHSKLPKYLPKQGRNLLTYTEQAISRAPKNRGYIVPSGLDIRVETRQSAIDQVRIVPHASHYTVEVVYERPVTLADVDPMRLAAMDIGLNNLAAVTTNQPGITSFLVQGRPLKALNQWYNKRRAQLQSKLPTGHYTSRQLDVLADKRGRQIASYLHVASRRIVDWLVVQRIGTLIIGKNDGWKQSVRLGKRNNQNFVFVPHARFIQMLQYKAELVGIRVLVAEESYTSKCSLLDLEPVGKHDAYAGKRVKRGLYRASDGRWLNADINGAYNILRKVVPNAFGNRIAGVVVHPVRLNLANGPHGSNVSVA
ncbi:MAG TPA: transposase [Ktedonobacterales bacterium]|jgi:putative transposase